MGTIERKAGQFIGVYLLTVVAAANIWSGVQTNNLMSKGYNLRKAESTFQKYCRDKHNEVFSSACEVLTFPGRLAVYVGRSLESTVEEFSQPLNKML